MLRTLIFKTSIFLWFLACSPFLLFGLISEKLERKVILFDAMGVLFLARFIAGIKYQIHYPSNNEDGIPFKHNINQRLDGRSIIASKHMSIMDSDLWLGLLENRFNRCQSCTRRNKYEYFGKPSNKKRHERYDIDYIPRRHTHCTKSSYSTKTRVVILGIKFEITNHPCWG